MILTLRPEVEKFIGEQVRDGRFPTPEAVVEAAILALRDDPPLEIDDETAAAINEAEAEIDRGEGMDLAAVRSHFSKRLAGNG